MTIEMTPDSQEKIDNAIDADSWEEVHLTEKADIIEHYKDTYKGDWRKHFTDEFAQVIGKSRNTASRDIQGDREGKAPRTAAKRKQYRDLGEKLPPVKRPRNLRGKRARVDATIYVTISTTYGKRHFTRELTAERTAQLLEDGGIDAIIEQYGIDPDEIEFLDVGEITVTFF